MREFVFFRKLGQDDLGAALFGAADQLGQAMIGLRPDHQVDDGRAAQNFRPLSLRDAAGHRNHAFPGRSARRLSRSKRSLPRSE